MNETNLQFDVYGTSSHLLKFENVYDFENKMKHDQEMLEDLKAYPYKDIYLQFSVTSSGRITVSVYRKRLYKSNKRLQKFENSPQISHEIMDFEILGTWVNLMHGKNWNHQLSIQFFCLPQKNNFQAESMDHP